MSNEIISYTAPAIPYADMERMAEVIAKSSLFGVKNFERSIRLLYRLFGRCKIVENCWLYLGSAGNSGYGKLRIGHTKDYSAHRLSFMIFNGEIPDNLCVLHKCDNRRCVNPEHLWIGTKRDNTLDMVIKGRQFSPARLRTHCPNGHEYSGVNSQGRRICRICQNAATLRHYHKTKGAA